ncbi:MAG: hypothetical protein ACE5IQ_03340 [Candidatus Methylomirabilales bacterium]
MDFRRTIGLVAVASVFTLPLTVPPRVAEAQTQPQWGRQAEDTFGLGRGMGRRLMSREEWQAHRQTMQRLSPEERQRYREQWHEKMVERARERGITMPETPGPHRGQGMGMGPGRGMGSGRGMMGPRGGGMGRGGR